MDLGCFGQKGPILGEESKFGALMSKISHSGRNPEFGVLR